jgi:pimeloyl-ACP methyl ester carboxylesterase
MRHAADTIEGVRLHWLEFDGPTDRTPVVLLHGLNDSHLTWRRVAPDLAKERPVFALDLPGHGLSERPDASYELSWYAHVVARWLEKRNLDSVDIVGHSFGGGVALTLLLECPKRLRRLVLVASGGLGREIAMSLRLASIPKVVERFGQPFMNVGTRLALMAMGRTLLAEDAHLLARMSAQRGTARAFARTVEDLMDWRGQRQSFLARAHEVSTLPAIAVFWGDRDTIIPHAHANMLRLSVEGVRLTLFPGCGHYPHEQRPDAFVAALRAFIDDPDCPSARLRPRILGSANASEMLRRLASPDRSSL